MEPAAKGRRKNEAKDRIMSESMKAGNQVRLIVLTVLTGAFAGAVVWCFLKAVSLGSALIWEVIPQGTGTRFILPALCAAGGLITGVVHHFSGNYPDELSVVLYKVKKEKHYDYHHFPAILASAFLPLVFGASVGPEAGLAGIIAALCYWVGDNVTFAKNYSALYSAVGEAVTLGQLFHSPLFGIFAVEESPDEEASYGEPMPRIWKLALYALSTAAGFGPVALLSFLFGKAMGGFPSFSEVSVSAKDYILLVLYFAVGFLMYIIYEGSEHVLEKVSLVIPGIVRETLCGMIIGITGILVPFVLFSGEEQMAELMERFREYTPLFLIGAALLKLVLTSFCLKFGMKGGHFFPLIFACACVGFALSMLFFEDPGSHAAFTAAIVTATALGAQLKKPVAVSFLLLLCFPVRLLFWIFLSAALGGALAKKIGERRKQGNP